MESSLYKRISDPIYGFIDITRLESEIISSTIFNRLHYVYQTSGVYLSNPSSQVKRFEHSIGTMHVAGYMFCRAIANSDDNILEQFFDEIINQLNSIFVRDSNGNIKDEDARYLLTHNIPDDYVDEIFNYSLEDLSYTKNNMDDAMSKQIPGNLYINEKAKYKTVYCLLWQTIRILALLHDIGHPPMSHLAEKALVDIVKTIKKWEEDKKINDDKRYFIDPVYKLCESGNQKQMHEYIGESLVKNLLKDLFNKDSTHYCEKIYNTAVDDDGIPQMQKVLLSCIFALRVLQYQNQTNLSEDSKNLYKFLKSFYDGTIDADRVDYLARSGHSEGWRIGYHYVELFSSLRIDYIDNSKKYILELHEKHIGEVEKFFVEYKRQYKLLIFGHKARRYDNLFMLILDDLVKELDESRFNKLKEQGSNNNCKIDTQIEYMARLLALSDDDTERNGIIVSQIDDNWLYYTIRTALLEFKSNGDVAKEIKRIKSKAKQNSDQLNDAEVEKLRKLYRLEEFVWQKKHYYSMFKSKIPQVSIDNKIFQILKNSDDIKKVNNTTLHLIDDWELKISNDSIENFEVTLSSKYKVQAKETIRHILDIVDGRDKNQKSSHYLTNRMLSLVRILYMDDRFLKLREDLRQKLNSINNEYLDVIIWQGNPRHPLKNLGKKLENENQLIDEDIVIYSSIQTNEPNKTTLLPLGAIEEFKPRDFIDEQDPHVFIAYTKDKKYANSNEDFMQCFAEVLCEPLINIAQKNNENKKTKTKDKVKETKEQNKKLKNK